MYTVIYFSVIVTNRVDKSKHIEIYTSLLTPTMIRTVATIRITPYIYYSVQNDRLCMRSIVLKEYSNSLRY